MIPKAEGIHAWYPPRGSGRVVTNLAKFGTAEAEKGWGVTKGASVTQETAAFTEAWSYAGAKSFHAKLKSTGASQSALVHVGSTGADDVAVAPGKTYAFSRRIKLVSKGAGTVRILVNWHSSAGTILSSSRKDLSPPLGESRISAAFTAPANAARAVFYFGHELTLQNGETFECYGDMTQVEEGDQATADFPTESQLFARKARFTGAAHESTATLDLPAIELGRLMTDAGEPLWPRFKLVRVTGLSSTGDAEVNADRPPAAPREVPRKSSRRGKTVAYEGILQARDVVQLREAEALFTTAFDDIEGLGRMDSFWHPLLVAARPALAAHPPKFFEATAVDAVIIDSQDSQSFERPFVVGLRLPDRRYFDEEGKVVNLTVANTNTEYGFAE